MPYCFDIENDYTKDINLITEIQIYDGYIKNLEQSLFGDCPKIEDAEVIEDIDEDEDNGLINDESNVDNESTDVIDDESG